MDFFLEKFNADCRCSKNKVLYKIFTFTILRLDFSRSHLEPWTVRSLQCVIEMSFFIITIPLSFLPNLYPSHFYFRGNNYRQKSGI